MFPVRKYIYTCPLRNTPHITRVVKSVPSTCYSHLGRKIS
jgi:hypothetical protein